MPGFSKPICCDANRFGNEIESDLLWVGVVIHNFSPITLKQKQEGPHSQNIQVAEEDQGQLDLCEYMMPT